MVVGDRPRAAAGCGGGIDRTTEPRGSWSVARIAAAWIFLLHVVTPACWVWGVASTSADAALCIFLAVLL